MRKIVKLSGIAVIAMVMVLSFTTCSNGSTGNYEYSCEYFTVSPSVYTAGMSTAGLPYTVNQLIDLNENDSHIAYSRIWNATSIIKDGLTMSELKKILKDDVGLNNALIDAVIEKVKKESFALAGEIKGGDYIIVEVLADLIP